MSFSNLSDVGREIIANLAKVNKRVYLVGLFSNYNRNKLVHFGPEELRRVRAASDLAGHVEFANRVDYSAFEDYLQPKVSEREVEKEGYYGVEVDVPPSTSESGGSERAINSFDLLYNGSPYADDGPFGQKLIQDLEGYLDSYLDFNDEIEELTRAFNRFEHAFARTWANRIHRPLLPPFGVTYHQNFEQCLVGYLLHEDPNLRFNHEELEWDTFGPGRNWGDPDKRIFARAVDEFKEALLDEHPNALDSELREKFQRRRQSILKIAKCVPNRVMLSGLPYWILHTLLGNRDEVHLVTDANALYDSIHSIDQSTRKWRVALPTRVVDVNLPKPLIRVPFENRDSFRANLKEKLGNLIDAWAEEGPQREEFLGELLGENLTEDERETLRSRLSNIYAICENSSQQASNIGRDPQAARERTLKAIRDAWVSNLESQFIEALIGEPKVFLSDIIDFYVADHLDLYMQSLLLQDNISASIRDVAGRGRNYISDQLSTGTKFEDIQNVVESEMLRLFTVTASRAFEGDVATRMSSLEFYVRMKAEKIAKVGQRVRPAIEHSKISESDNLPFSAGRTTGHDFHAQLLAETGQGTQSEELVEVAVAASAARSGAQAAGATAGGAGSASGGPAPSGDSGAASTTGGSDGPADDAGQTTDSSAEDGRSKLAELIAELSAQAARSGDSQQKPADGAEGEPTGPDSETDVDTGIQIIIKQAEQALADIREVRRNPETPEAFKRKCRRVALAEMMIAKNQSLGFGKPMSKLYELTLDLLVYGAEQPDRFLQENSLTKYYDLPGGLELYSLFERLGNLADESRKKMARLFSEVRGVRYLLEQVGNRLRDDCELFIFNGTGAEFLNWVYETNEDASRQFWLESNHASTHFILPGLIYVLESAYASETGSPDEEGGSFGGDTFGGLFNFLEAIRGFQTEVNGSYALPPMIISTSLPFDTPAKGDNRLWHEIIRESLLETSLHSSYPNAIYVVGPARRLPDAPTLTRPAGFYVVESILNRGRVPGPGSELGIRMVDNVDHPRDVLPEGCFSLTKYPISIQQGLDLLKSKGIMGSCAPLEGSMWLHIVSLLYLAVKHSPGYVDRDKTNFCRVFAKIANPDVNVQGIKRRTRAHAQDCLNVLGKNTNNVSDIEDINRFSYDFEGGKLLMLGGPKETKIDEYTEIEFEAAWFKRVIDR